MRPNRRTIVSWVLLLGMSIAVGIGCESVGLRSMKIYMQQQNWEKALEQGWTAVGENPNDAAAWYNMAIVAGQIDSIDTMIEASERAKALTDEYDEDLDNLATSKYNEFFNMGVQSFNQKNYERATNQLQTAYKIAPDRPNAPKVLGLISQVTGDIDQALEYFLEAFRADESDTELARQYASLLNSQGDRAGAIAFLEPVYQTNPTEKELVLTYTMLLQAEHQYDTAIAAVGTALAEAPEDESLNMQAGVLYMSKSQSTETDSMAAVEAVEMAVPRFEKVIEVDSANVDAAFNLALAYRALGQLDKSAEPLQAVVLISPDDFQARMQLATVLLQLERPEDAEPHLVRIVEQIGEPTSSDERRVIRQAYRYLRIIYTVRGNNISVQAQELREQASEAPRSQRAGLRSQAEELETQANELIQKAEEMSQAAEMYGE